MDEAVTRAVAVLAVLGVAIGAALWIQGKIIKRVVRAAVAVVGLVLLYTAITFGQVWYSSTRDDRSPASAIVVLGAAQWNGKPSPVLRSRLDQAIELYREGAAPKIIVTGGKQEGDRVGEAFASYDYLKAHGVPEDDIKIENKGMDTYEELSASAHILDVIGLDRRVILVSSPYHAHRARAVADEVGLQAQFSPAGDDLSWRALARETAAVSAGRLISYRRLSNLQ